MAAAFGSAAKGSPNVPHAQYARVMELPKAAKSNDIDRILHSPNSEDYVTGTSSIAFVQTKVVA